METKKHHHNGHTATQKHAPMTDLFSAYASLYEQQAKWAAETYRNFSGSFQEEDSKMPRSFFAPDYFFENGQLRKMNANPFLFDREAPARINEKYKNVLESRFGLFQKMYEEWLRVYNAQLDFSKENGRKSLEEVSKQFYEMNKQYQLFWSEVVSAFFAPLTREPKATKENSPTALKEIAEPVSNN